MFKKNKKNQMNNNTRHLITKINPKSPISEQYRILRTNIQFSGIDQTIKSVVVSSIELEAGKSMTAANLAIVYAQQGKKTLLIDADMRKPTAHYTFRLDNLMGLSNALVDGHRVTDVVAKSDVDNLDVLSCGPIPPNPSELLASKRFESFLKEAQGLYEMIIIDTPPLIAVTDARILVNLVDGSLLVARKDQSEYEQLEEAVEQIKQSADNLLGVVLNDVDKKEDDYYYYYS